MKIKIYSDNDIREYDLNSYGKDTVTFGRGNDCDIKIDKDYVSRHHGCFNREGNEWYINDLGSLNGTYKNSEKIIQGKMKGETYRIFSKNGGSRVKIVGYDMTSQVVQSDNRSKKGVTIAGVLAGIGIIIIGTVLVLYALDIIKWDFGKEKTIVATVSSTESQKDKEVKSDNPNDSDKNQGDRKTEASTDTSKDDNNNDDNEERAEKNEEKSTGEKNTQSDTQDNDKDNPDESDFYSEPVRSFIEIINGKSQLNNSIYIDKVDFSYITDASKVGYDKCDLNGDGIGELILLYEGQPVALCAYSIKNNNVRCLVGGGVRFGFDIRTDNKIIQYGSAGAASAMNGLFRIDSSGDYVADIVYFTAPNEDWSGTYYYKTENYDDVWDVEKSTQITEDEYNQGLDNISNCEKMRFDNHPISDYE